jgi:uncharacterized DUF497 family protein
MSRSGSHARPGLRRPVSVGAEKGRSQGVKLGEDLAHRAQEIGRQHHAAVGSAPPRIHQDARCVRHWHQLTVRELHPPAASGTLSGDPRRTGKGILFEVRFEWDDEKEEANLSKHGVSFAEAATALRDPLSVTASDPDHSEMEQRFLTFGVSADGRLLVVAHTEQEEVLRIISGRLATGPEQRIYEEG